MERHAPGADKAGNVSANLLLAAPSAGTDQRVVCWLHSVSRSS